MKIIDLLNKIANGEEVPKKIKIKTHIFTTYNYPKGDGTFVASYESNNDGEYHINDFLYPQYLNDEIEILEEKKIPEKLEEFGIQYNLDYIDYKNIETLKEWLNKDFQTIYDTLDLIIKNQNQLIDYLKSKGDK